MHFCILPFSCLPFICLQSKALHFFRKEMHCNSNHLSPCLQCHPHSYIRMVQHLIERCLLLRMNREECIRALEEHAKIRPLVTLTVWRELLKENRGFFHAYFHGISSRPLLRTDTQQYYAAPSLTRMRQQWK